MTNRCFGIVFCNDDWRVLRSHECVSNHHQLLIDNHLFSWLCHVTHRCMSSRIHPYCLSHSHSRMRWGARSQSWPSAGRLEFRNVSLRYRPGNATCQNRRCWISIIMLLSKSVFLIDWRLCVFRLLVDRFVRDVCELGAPLALDDISFVVLPREKGKYVVLLFVSVVALFFLI